MPPTTSSRPVPRPDAKLADATDFASFTDSLVGLINLVIPLIFGLVLIIIIWKIIDAWILGGGDEKKVEEGKQYALVGVIVLVTMVSIWGIVRLFSGALFGV